MYYAKKLYLHYPIQLLQQLYKEGTIYTPFYRLEIWSSKNKVFAQENFWIGGKMTFRLKDLSSPPPPSPTFYTTNSKSKNNKNKQ